MKRSIVILSITAALAVAPIAGWYVGGAVHAQGVAEGAESVDAGPELAVDAGAAAAVAPEPEPSVVVVGIAQTPRPPSPVDDAQTYFETLESWWKSGKMKPAILLALFGLLIGLSTYVPWLQVGWRAAAIAAAVEVLGDLVARAAAGVDITVGLLQSAVFTAVLMFINARRRPKEPGPPSAGAVGAGG